VEVIVEDGSVVHAHPFGRSREKRCVSRGRSRCRGSPVAGGRAGIGVTIVSPEVFAGSKRRWPGAVTAALGCGLWIWTREESPVDTTWCGPSHAPSGGRSFRMRVYPDGPRTSRVASPVSEQPDKAVSDLSLCELFSVEVRTMYCVVLATHPNPVLDEIPGQLGVGPVLVHRQLFFNSLSRFIVTAVSQYRIDPSTAGGGWQTVIAIAISRNAGLCPRSLAFTHARTSLIPGDTNRQVVQSMNVTAGSTASSRC
jgi:hypothetical protein